MTDYRKAVELADGFSWRGETYLGKTDDPTILVNTPFGVSMPVDEQAFKDALAAQLLRQYRKSALESGHVVRWINFSRDYRRVPLDQDLTDFTINAILESGVLAPSTK